MNRCLLAVAIAGLGVAGSLQAQTGIAADVKQAYTRVKNNLLKTADKVPAEDYSFKPTPEIRSFAEVLGHVVDSQMRTCSAVAGDQPGAGAAGKTSKADITAALQAAFTECDKAYDALTDANATEVIKAGPRQLSRAGLLMGNVAHDSEQYGILSVYMRLKGIVPPSSERPAGR